MTRARPLRNQTEVLTVFGLIEAVIATMMAGEHGLHKIEPRDFPPTVAQVDDVGRTARFAIVMPAKHLVEFHERCAKLRA